MSKPINSQLLKKLGACLEQTVLFEKIFGDSDAPLVVETATKHAFDFDFYWAANNLLSEKRLKIYREAISSDLRNYAKSMTAADSLSRKNMMNSQHHLGKSFKKQAH